MHLATDIYHNDPKFLCWQTMSKRADQDHTEQSDQDLKCLPGHLHLLNTLLYGKSMFCKVKDIYITLLYSKFLGVLVYM